MEPLRVKHAKSELSLPLLASPKYDGIRALVVEGCALTRRWKFVPNVYIRSCLQMLPDGIDGELYAGTFQETQSAVMRRAGRPAFTYYAFDLQLDATYEERIRRLSELELPPFVQTVTPLRIHSMEDLRAYEQSAIAAGFEGIVVRDPDGPYADGYAWKMKRVQDSEAVVLGFVEQMHNANAVQYSVFGRARRPGGRSGKVPMGVLGALQVQDCSTSVQFEVGTGFTAAQRAEIWSNWQAYYGRIVRYAYQSVGSDKRPRFPSFQGFRDD